jgi:hypothetical protein
VLTARNPLPAGEHLSGLSTVVDKTLEPRLAKIWNLKRNVERRSKMQKKLGCQMLAFSIVLGVLLIFATTSSLFSKSSPNPPNPSPGESGECWVPDIVLKGRLIAVNDLLDPSNNSCSCPAGIPPEECVCGFTGAFVGEREVWGKAGGRVSNPVALGPLRLPSETCTSFFELTKDTLLWQFVGLAPDHLVPGREGAVLFMYISKVRSFAKADQIADYGEGKRAGIDADVDISIYDCPL